MQKTLSIAAILDLVKGIESIKAFYNEKENVAKFGLPLPSFSYAINRTKTKLQGVWDAVVEMEKPLPGMTAFQEKARAILTDGLPDGNKRVEELSQGEFKDLFALQKSRSEQIQAHLKTEESVDLYMVSEEVFLKTEIPPAAQAQLLPMVSEPEAKA